MIGERDRGPVLILATTSWHVFAALGLIHGPYAGRRVQLVLGDQPQGRASPWRAVLAGAPGFAFAEWPAIGKRPLDKLCRSRAVLHAVDAMVRRLEPSEIVCGNDRRVEFQYAMHRAAALGSRPLGVYLDDGTFSYSGLVTLRRARFAPQLEALERRAARLFFGSWRESPRTLGTSRWVDRAWLAFPEHAHAALRARPCDALDPAWYRHPAVLDACAQLLRGLDFDAGRLAGVDVLVLFPHDHLLAADALLRQRYAEVIGTALAAGQRVAVKRHPRSREALVPYPADAVVELPARLPLEALAAHLGPVRVYSGLSTVLVNLRWLRPDVVVQALSGGTALRDPLAPLYASIGVRAAPD